MKPLDPRTIPLLRSDVVHRDDPTGRLLFQISTDEMYLVDEPTFALLQLCDGERTIHAIAEIVADAKQVTPAAVVDRLQVFIADLHERGLVDLWEPS